MNNDNDKILYKVGLGILALSILIIALIQIFRINYQLFFLPCLFNLLTGLYCPGCGGTRSVISLIHGYPIASLKYNPIVIYGVAIYAWYMLSNTIELLSKHTIKIGMKYRDFYLWLGLGILLLFCFIRNLLLVAFGIDITFI